MALPYPEGEVYFKRSALSFTDNGWSFVINVDDADAAKGMEVFNKHCLIEWVWNEPCPANTDFTDNRLPPRCKNTRADKDGIGDNRVYWDYLPVMFGDAEDLSFRSIKRHVQLQTPRRGNGEYKKRGAGGPAKIVLSPVELLNDKDGPLPFMWIDLNFPVRAIYLPLQYQPSKDYPDLCSYLMLDFRLRKGVKMFDQKDYSMDGLPTRHDVPFDNKLGLGYRPRQTLGIDIRGVYNFLILPRQLRSAEKGLFMPTDPADALVRLTGPENPSVPSQAQPDRGFIQLPFTDKLDIAHVINEHFGVELTYIPFEMPPDAETPMEEVRSILKMAVGVGLGFIPGVGPLVQRGFMIVMAIAEDPEGFKNRDPLELGLSIADAVAESALQLRGNMSYIGKGSAKGQRKGIVSEIGLKTINFSSKTLLKDEPEIGADPKDEKEKPTIRTGLTVG